jgi:hypothetical protein
MNKKLLFVLIALMIVVYIRSAIEINKGFDMVQTNISDINIDMLMEKIPIIINEGIVNPNDLTYSIFRFLYSYKKIGELKPCDTYQKARSRFTILYNDTESCTVNVKHPSFEKNVDVQLLKNQCIIIPFRWVYKSEQKIKSIQLYDMLSILCLLFV